MSRELPPGRPVGRRAVLGVAGVTLAGSAGCLQRAQNLAAHDPAERVSLAIKTMPADDDPYPIRIAQRLADHLSAVGVGVEVVPMRNDQLLRDVLVEGDFDVYVAAHPGGADPDFLYPLLHSRFAADPGWANPFGFADLETDERLERQRRRTGAARRRTVAELQRGVATRQPFTVVALPDAIRAIRPTRFHGWRPPVRNPTVRYLTLRGARSSGETGDGNATASAGPDAAPRTLRVAITDDRPTENLNPIAVRFRSRAPVTDLLYDPLALADRGEAVPWLAETWTWERGPDRSGPVARVRLRGDATWHDGRPVTAADVAFTFRFLADTTLGAAERAVPAPRYRGGASLVRGTTVVDDRTVRLAFVRADRSVARRALSVPVLPAHEWRHRTDEADLVGLDLGSGATEAIVRANMDPVGSGPFRFVRAVTDEVVILEAFGDHFARTGGAGLPDRLAGPPAFDRLAFRVVPSDGAAIELLEAGEVDATGAAITADGVSAAVRSEAAELTVRRSRSFYHVGYNARREPLSNPHFRRAVARLVDEAGIVSEVFGGYAVPAATPLARTDWLAPDLGWAGRDPVLPFVGDDDGLDVDRARTVFESAGYRYDGAGRLRR